MPTGRPQTCAFIGRPCCVAAVSRSSSSLYCSGARRFWTSENDSGRRLRSTSRRSSANSLSGSVKSETNCKTPRPAAASPSRDARELVFCRGQRRRRLPVARAVIQRARGREARARLRRRLVARARPSARCRPGGRLALRAALAHHEHAQRRVRQLRAHVDVEAALPEGIEVVGEALPVPRQPLREHRERDVWTHGERERGERTKCMCRADLRGTGRSSPITSMPSGSGASTSTWACSCRTLPAGVRDGRARRAARTGTQDDIAQMARAGARAR